MLSNLYVNWKLECRSIIAVRLRVLIVAMGRFLPQHWFKSREFYDQGLLVGQCWMEKKHFAMKLIQNSNNYAVENTVNIMIKNHDSPIRDAKCDPSCRQASLLSQGMDTKLNWIDPLKGGEEWWSLLWRTIVAEANSNSHTVWLRVWFKETLAVAWTQRQKCMDSCCWGSPYLHENEVHSITTPNSNEGEIIHFHNGKTQTSFQVWLVEIFLHKCLI